MHEFENTLLKKYSSFMVKKLYSSSFNSENQYRPVV